MKKILSAMLAMAIGGIISASEIHELHEFGDVSSSAAAKATYKKAVKEITASGGGILYITNKTAKGFEPESPIQKNLSANSVTAIDIRGGKTRMVLPSLGFRMPDDPHGYGGLFLDRQINQEAINVNGNNVNLRISNRVVKGLTSYFQKVNDYELQPDGKMKIYPPTLAGLNAGAVLFVLQGKGGKGRSGEFETPSRLTAKITRLGWDHAKRKGFIVMQRLNPRDKWGKLTALINKSSAGTVYIGDTIHCDGEIAGSISLQKKIFGQGDNFGMAMRYMYMGNIMSTGGDENGCGYTVDTWQMLDSFKGKVETWNPKTGELVYTKKSTRANTLGTSRPMINLNPKKWITKGKIKVMANNSNGDSARNGYVLGVGVDWSPDIIGRAIAVNIPEEYCGTSKVGFWKHNLAGRKVRRWWRISGYRKMPNGEQRIWVERTRWWINAKATLTLINEKNYFKELPYIIAPCALVADVSEGVLAENKSSIKGRSIMPKPGDKRLVWLAPPGCTGTRFDFAPGDPIEQAIGPDPRHVVGYRVRHREANPTMLPSASFYSINNGAYPVYAGLLVGAGHDKMQIPHHNKYRSGVQIFASCDNAIKIDGKTGNAAILLEEFTGKPQKIVWNGPRTRTVLLATPRSGDLKLVGGALDLSGRQVFEISGISATRKKSLNLRGIGINVNAGKKELNVKFSKPEPDAVYAVAVTPSWLTTLAVTKKAEGGFKVDFGTPAPENAKVDWILIR